MKPFFYSTLFAAGFVFAAADSQSFQAFLLTKAVAAGCFLMTLTEIDE